MARIPDDELQRVKREIKLVELVGDYGVELKQIGPDNWMGRCPFHQDDTPSFGVTPSKNLWNCLAGCGGGDNVQFVMRKEGVSFRHAVEKLQLRRGRAPSTPTMKLRGGKERPILVDPTVAHPDHAVLAQVVEFYHQTFLNDPKAMRYLEQRRCLHPEAIKAFKLGYANRTLGYRLPKQDGAVGRALRAQMQRVGVMRESGHEHLSGSVVIPIFATHGGERGPVTQMYGRKLTPTLREGTPKHLYLPGPLRGVFNGLAMAQQKEWLLCEALLDALTFWSHGFRNVTASFGVRGFTEDHWALLRACRPARVVLCYDHDEAGNKAAEELAGQLMAEGVAVWRTALPPGASRNGVKDINDVARAAKNPTTALAALLERATLMQCSPHGPPAQPGPNEAQSTASVLVASLVTDTAATMAETKPGDDPPSEMSVAEPVEQIQGEPESRLNETEPRSDAAVLPPSEPPGAPLSSLAASLPTSPDPAPERPKAVPCDTKTLNIPTEQRGEDIEITLGERQYRVRGLAKNLSFELLKVNVRVMQGDKYYLDTFDLYNARARQNFYSTAAQELQLQPDTIKKDLGKVLLKLEELQEQLIKKTLEPQKKEVVMTDAERQAALDFLRDPRLLERLLSDFARCGMVGEATNKLLGYLAAVSRKLESPLAVMIQSTSAAGKSALMEAVLSFMPEEDRIKYSAMTGQSLFYLGEMDLKHKILAIVEEEGAERASYALKLLQSEGELTIASTGKDPQTGRLVTQEYHVEGPVMIFLTTTAVDIDEELLNRCLVLTVDEGREQTRAIHRMQRERETLTGLLCRLEKTDTVQVHRNAQRLLRPLAVVNPFAHKLTFLDDRTRLRRDHMKYLILIRTIALLHQYQRPLKTVPHRGKAITYLEVTLSDIATANRLAHEVLGRSLDELPPQTRRLLLLLDEMARAECQQRKLDRADWRFSRREVRAFTGWGDTQLKIHLQRLTDLEYVLVHRGGRGQSFVYELLYQGQGQDGRAFLMGLTDLEKIKPEDAQPVYDGQWSGQNGAWSGSGRPLVGGVSGDGRTEANTLSTKPEGALLNGEAEMHENAVLPDHAPRSSHTSLIEAAEAAPTGGRA